MINSKDKENKEKTIKRITNAVILDKNKYIHTVGPCQSGKTECAIYRPMNELINYYYKLGYIPHEDIAVPYYINHNVKTNNIGKIEFIGIFNISSNTSRDQLRNKIDDIFDTGYLFNDVGEPIVSVEKLKNKINHFSTTKAFSKLKNNPKNIYLVVSDEDHLTKAEDSRFAAVQEALGFDLSKPHNEWKNDNIIYLSTSATDFEAMRAGNAKFLYVRPGENYRYKHKTLVINNMFDVNDDLTKEMKNEIECWVKDRINIGGNIIIRCSNRNCVKNIEKFKNSLMFIDKTPINIEHTDYHNKNKNLSGYIAAIEKYKPKKFNIITIHDAGGASDSIKCNGPILWCCNRIQGSSAIQSCGRMNGYPTGGLWNDLNGDRTIIVNSEAKKALDAYNEWIDHQNTIFDNGNDFDLSDIPKISSTYTGFETKEEYRHEIYITDNRITTDELNAYLIKKYPEEYPEGIDPDIKISYHHVSKNKSLNNIEQLNLNEFKEQYIPGAYGFKCIYVDTYSHQEVELKNKSLFGKYIVAIPFPTKKITIREKSHLKKINN